MTLAVKHTTDSWNRLETHRQSLKSFSLRQALQDRSRYDLLTCSAAGLFFDFAKHLVTPETIRLLLELAKDAGVPQQRERMFKGEPINSTEHRAVLHTALRAPATEQILVDGVDVIPEVHANLQRCGQFAEQIRSGALKSYAGKTFTDVVNIGIGGSDLGPRFVTEALQDYHGNLRIHFVSNVDGALISRTLKTLDPQTTLVVIASKTFTTEETMLNAHVAKDWMVKHSGSEASIRTNFAALSTNGKKVEAFGINPDYMFPFRDWVGGRYSVWSAIGLSVMLAIGADNFQSFLHGARAMDEHFITTPLDKNVPVMMAMLGVWYRNFWDYPAHLLLPYDDRLQRLAKYIQQMDMESNGKAVGHDGLPLAIESGPFIFGEPGTDSQHSFMQLVHQGTTPIPADLIACKKPHHDLSANHASLLSNCLAQSRALAIGQTLEEAGGDPFRVFSGNRPTTTILMPELTPYNLGALLAAYEHKVFVQGIIWNVNSFDQPGVELGKKIAKVIRSRIHAQPAVEDHLDLSSEGLLARLNS